MALGRQTMGILERGVLHAQGAGRFGHAGGKLFMVSADMVADRGGRVIC